MTELTKAEIEQKVLEDYHALAGKVVLLTEVECYDERGASETVTCDPPAIGRVMPTDAKSIDTDILRWMDGENCDPTYSVWILERHPAFEDVRPAWAYGTSYCTDGTSSPGGITLAGPDLQRRYQHAPGLPNREVGDCAAPAGMTP